MMRMLALFAALFGLLIGIAFPGLVSSDETGEEFAVALTPSTLSSGSEPTLNCGWHTACVSPWTSSGIALDWEDGAVDPPFRRGERLPVLAVC